MQVSRDSDHPVITEADIHAGCAVQMRGSLQMRQFDQRCVPKTGLPALVLAKDARANIEEVVRFEKARAVLFGEWGYGDPNFSGGLDDGSNGGGGGLGAQQGTTAMLWGAPGTGKSRVAEAIGFECGRPLKVVNFLEVLHRSGGSGGSGGRSSSSGSNSSGARAIFDDARLVQAIVVLDRFDVAPFARDCEVLSPAAQDLLYHMERFPGMVVLLVSADVELSMALHKLHPGFLSVLKFSVRKQNRRGAGLRVCEHTRPKIIA